MAHAAKYSKASAGYLMAHYERKKNENGDYIKFKNQDIDLSKTHLNYNLAPHHDGGQFDFIRRRTSEVHCIKRDDVNVMCSWVVTLPKPNINADYARLDGVRMSLDKGKIADLFFQRTYRFLADRYGEQNVISAYVHKDELTPHIHFAFVPVVTDKKKGGFKVSAKEVLTLKELQIFHTELSKYHDSFGDWKFDVLNESTKEGNKEIAELKMDSLRQDIEQAQKEVIEAHRAIDAVRGDIKHAEGQKKSLQSEIEALRTAKEEQARKELTEAHRMLDSVKGDIKHAEEQKKGLQSEIEALRTAKETMTAAEVTAIKEDKTIFGGLKGVTYKEFETVKRTAEKVSDMEQEKDQALNRADQAEKNADSIVKIANAKIAELQAINKANEEKANSIISNFQKENAGLNQKNAVLQSEVGSLKALLRETLDTAMDFLRGFPALLGKILFVLKPPDSERAPQTKKKDNRGDR